MCTNLKWVLCCSHWIIERNKWFLQCILILIFVLLFRYFSVLTELVTSMHSLREKHNIKRHCACTSKLNLLSKLPTTNGVSQVSCLCFVFSDCSRLASIPIMSISFGAVNNTNSLQRPWCTQMHNKWTKWIILTLHLKACYVAPWMTGKQFRV